MKHQRVLTAGVRFMRRLKTHSLIAWMMAVLLIWGTAMQVFAEDFDSALEGLLTGGQQSGCGQAETQQEDIQQSDTETETEPPVYPQLTAEDIVRLDEGDAEVIFNDEGRATFIRGRYSPEKVRDENDAVESLNYVATLLGLTNGALFFCVYKGIDYATGYTFYLFLQRDGDVTLVNASIKIYVDPDGYTAALSCSFNPTAGVREESANKISKSEAEEIVRTVFKDYDIIIYEDATTQAGVMEEGQNRHVWSVYSNNPDMSSGDSDQPYIQHFVDYSGHYLMNLPADTLKSPLLEKDDALERSAKAMFEGYEPDIWKGEVTLHNGKKAELEIPVARSKEDGRYYLIDLDRMMMVADFREAIYGSGEYIISSSDTNSGWKDRELIAMYNIGRAYDYYADHGLVSVDGSGIPMMILSGVSEPDGTAIDNAFFYGFRDGFGIFAISDINNTVESLDIMAHEFTHGITSYTMGGSAYVNEMGAVNEAYSDIMGNLCELTYSLNDASIAQGKTKGQFDITGISLVGSTDDPDPDVPDWRIGEMCGKTYRDMSDPIEYLQPAFAGDAYYCLPTTHSSDMGNDYGGVHKNSSLLGNIAWVMNEHGLTYEDQYSLWMTAMNMMTPMSNYGDILQALIFARKTYGFDDEVDVWLSEAFAERGLLENSHSYSGTWDGVSFADYNADLLVSTPKQAQDPGLGSGTGQGASLDQATDLSKISDLSGDLTGGLIRNKEDWLAGVGIDQEGNITREGFGRIEIETAPEDREILIGASILEPYTYRILSLNCLNEEGKFEFLIPEGTYFITLNVGRGGLLPVENWVYTMSGSYEKFDVLTRIAEVKVEAGKTVKLPLANVS